MHEEFIREQIASGAATDVVQARRLIADIEGAYWPGGARDRVDPVALDWLRRWRPATASAAIPRCSCAHGQCSICN
jgi:hypothetical protein